MKCTKLVFYLLIFSCINFQVVHASFPGQLTGGGFTGSNNKKTTSNNKTETNTSKTETKKNANTIKVYGRTACPRTSSMMSYLKERNVSYSFYSIDDQNISGPLFERIEKAGMKQDGYALPIIEVGKKIHINPRPEAISK